MSRKQQDDPTQELPEQDAGRSSITLANHPRAMRSIETLRAWAGVLGFGLTMVLGWRAGVPFVELTARSIAIGAAAYLVMWAGAQSVWKQIVYAEVAAARRRANEQRLALLEEAEALAAEAAGDAPPQR